jgi:hypothetical protein
VRALRIGPLVHTHGTIAHDHTHVQRGPRWIRRVGHPHASFALGLLHGAAGSSHVLGIVPALALPSAAGAVLYLGAFGCGSIAAMAGFAATVGRLKVLGPLHLERMLMAGCGATALAVGAAWLLGASV